MIYEVKFRNGQQNMLIECDEAYEKMEAVLVDTAKGRLYGEIVRQLEGKKKLIKDESEIVGRPTEADIENMRYLDEIAEDTKRTIRELIIENNLKMKLVDAAYSLDRGQLFISFTAEERVDFRQLLRDLASTFKTRIELRQIGSRDAAKIYGGIGPCGRPLCCSEFIYEFPNVSIKMAKNQTLSLNQSKLNGLCGRLMCCLTYEDKFYQEAQKNFPDYGQMVETVEGTGKVIGLNVIANRVKIRVANSIREIMLDEILVK